MKKTTTAPTPAQMTEAIKAKALEDMKAAGAAMREALRLIARAKLGYETVAKATGKWNHPIEDLGYYGRRLNEMLNGQGGEGGFQQLTK